MGTMSWKVNKLIEFFKNAHLKQTATFHPHEKSTQDAHLFAALCSSPASDISLRKLEFLFILKPNPLRQTLIAHPTQRSAKQTITGQLPPTARQWEECGTYILLEWPSFPSSPSPQEKTLPSTVKAMAWRPPAGQAGRRSISPARLNMLHTFSF